MSISEEEISRIEANEVNERIVRKLAKTGIGFSSFAYERPVIKSNGGFIPDDVFMMTRTKNFSDGWIGMVFGYFNARTMFTSVRLMSKMPAAIGYVHPVVEI